MARRSTAERGFALLVLLTCLGLLPSRAQTTDGDRDGISDRDEQLLLERFRPTFMISATDCADRPARFAEGQTGPSVVGADGTIYGQVFPIDEKRVEIHFYTLWARDCGRMPHPLDAEHVSLMIAVSPGTEPKQLYWYAGAHEKTACDMSSGARAEAVSSGPDGPVVWSSSGKHALYFRKELCGGGCGADSCLDNVELRESGPVVNIGELTAPMNGSDWVRSPEWPLADKMHSDFSNEVMARLDAISDDAVLTLRGSRTLRGTIQGGDAALGGAASGAEHTEDALDTANGNTSKSLDTAARATRRALRRAWKATFPAQGSPASH